MSIYTEVMLQNIGKNQIFGPHLNWYVNVCIHTINCMSVSETCGECVSSHHTGHPGGEDHESAEIKMTIANTVISQENASLQSMGTEQLLNLFTLDNVSPYKLLHAYKTPSHEAALP